MAESTATEVRKWYRQGWSILIDIELSIRTDSKKLSFDMTIHRLIFMLESAANVGDGLENCNECLMKQEYGK